MDGQPIGTDVQQHPLSNDKEDATGATGHSHCLNCEQALSGPYCHACGQKAHVHRSLSAIVHEFAHGVVHFEGRFWESLPLLAWRPGELTRRYINGERARFMSPLGLFLLAVFLTYATFSLIGAAPIGELQVERQVQAENREQAEQELKEAGGDVRMILRDSVARGTGQDARDIEKLITNVERNPKLLLYKLQANAYKFAWALIPLSLPFLWLLFPFSRRFRAYDHFVFITYSISFMLILSVIVRIAALTPLANAAIYAAMAFVPLHMFRQLRGAYDLSIGAALWRAILLCLISLVIGFGFLAGLMLLGASNL